MGKLAKEVKELRARRNAARETFDSRLTQVRQDLTARSIAGRLADKLEQEASDALAEALDIVNDSKGVVLGTAAALALWYLRNPILGWVEGMFAPSHASGHGEDGQAGESGDTAASADTTPPEPEDVDLPEVTNF